MKLEFLGCGLRTQAQACVRMQDYAYAAYCPKNLKNQNRAKP